MPIVVLMGVAGSGKTTLGLEVASHSGWDFHDADDFHPPANIAKMARNKPLTDSDRSPWLDTLRQLLNRYASNSQSMVLACSALKYSYRQHLLGECPQAQLVYLQGTPDLIRARLRQRQHPFATVDLLDSQFADLEEPREGREQALTIDVGQPRAKIISDIVHYLKNSPSLRIAP
ncbi:MAG: gluconokinase [Cyanobacteria bacterium P01_G01_bin.4]